MRKKQQEFSLSWMNTKQRALSEQECSIQLETERGTIDTRFHPAIDNGAAATSGVIWVGGSGGGLDGPARGLYPAMCQRLQEQGIAGLRLHYRYPNDLEECTLDTLLGVKFLQEQGVDLVALVGHSFGGAVVINAGAISEQVRAVVPMSTQTYGADLAPQIAPRALLLIHGTSDSVLPDACSRQVYAAAGEPKDLVLYFGAGRGLDECREELIELLTRWLPQHLAPVKGSKELSG